MSPIPPLDSAGRLLVVKTSSLGDVLHALPSVSAIRAARPDVPLDWVVRRRCADILRGCPLIDRLWVIGNKPSFGELVRLRQGFRQLGYGLALEMQGLALSGLVARLSGAPVRVGWDRNREFNAAFLTHPLVRGRIKDVGVRHEVDLLMGFAGVLGASPELQCFPPQGYLASEGRERAAGWLAGLPRPWVALNIGSARPSKRWPADHWRGLARHLIGQGVGVVFVGDSNDAPTVAGILAGLPLGFTRDVSGRTGLRELASVLEACDLVVSGDTGPMHLAVAVGTPVVALFGATDPRRHGPYGPQHVILSDSASVTNRRPTQEEGEAAMQRISREAVAQAIGVALSHPHQRHA